MKHIATICGLLLLAAGGCGDDLSDSPSKDADIRLYVFDCGKARFESIAIFSINDDETDVRDLIVPCYVIEHSKGRMLWDGGLPSDTADTNGWHGGGLKMRLDRVLADQLSEIGLDMGSFDYVAFSHMHFDHVGVANELQGGRLIIQKPEYEGAFFEPLTVPGANRKLYDQLADFERTVIDGDYDVFGDGRVIIMSAPGHTPGHQVLFIDLEKYGPIVLSGDLYHFALSREDRRVPTFNFDEAETLRSMDRVEEFLETSGAELWIEHELAWFEQLKKSPAYYE